MKRLFVLLPASLALSAPALAADIGTFQTSEWYEMVPASDGHLVSFQVHYPATSSAYGADADPSAGPFPVIAFMHGYGGQAWMYDIPCDAFASMGFVVVNIDTESGLFIDTDALAYDARTALRWLDARSADPDHWLAGMASDDDWTAMGHSMGGVALARLVSIEPRVQTVVGFNPYEASGDEYAAYETFGGSALMIGGTDDDTATPAMVRTWFDAVPAADRSVYLSVEGLGHGAIEDLDWGGDGAMDEGLQQDAEIGFAETFLQSEVFGDDNGWTDLVCDAAVSFDVALSDTVEPVTAADPASAREVHLSLGARRGATAVVYAGSGRGDSDVGIGDHLQLADAVEIARVDLPDGLLCSTVTVPAALAGSAWLQVAFTSEDTVTLGRVVDAFGAGADLAPPPGADDAPRPNADGAEASGGCSTAPGAPWLFVAGLIALGLRRSR